jgi:hypothetical protein
MNLSRDKMFIHYPKVINFLTAILIEEAMAFPLLPLMLYRDNNL